MNKLQKFALENIYCAPGQDQQFSFSLVRVNKVSQPLTSVVSVYNVTKRLPNANYRYHVFVLGNVNPNLLNLLRQGKDWYKDVWIKASDDMVARNYLFKIYNDKGVVFPRQHIYYSFIDENSIIFALEFEYTLRQSFDVDSFKYIHVYSNSFFDSAEYLGYPVRNGIQYVMNFVFNNADKVALQNQILNWKSAGGEAIVYVNGYYTDSLNLNIPDNSYIEVVYDQSIISKEKFTIGDLRTFESTKDDKLKYLVFRDNIIDSIQFKDDVEVYISNDGELVTKGLFFYQHKDYAVRNVTDKDFSFYTSFVNNTATEVTNLTSGALQDKIIVLHTRKAGVTRQLVYSAPKMHELYKLPQDVELDVMTNNNYTLPDFRAATLENSDYFKVCNLNGIKNLSIDLALGAMGYGGTSFYFANTPKSVPWGDTNVQVPLLYQQDSLAFEYDHLGQFIGWYTTSGPMYLFNNPTTRHVEFLYGETPSDFGRLYENNETVTLLHDEYKVLSAYFSGVTRITNWEDITNDLSRCSEDDGVLTITEPLDHKVKIIYLNQPNVYDLSLPLVDGVLYFPLTIREDRGTGVQTFPADVPYSHIEIFLNKHKLTPGLDYFMKFPYVAICNKEYINYTLPEQQIHIRMYGFTLEKADINKHEKTGFVNHGVLLRNTVYDVRDDRVMSIFVKGRLQDRSLVKFAEDDNTVRMNDPLNGLPYTIKEPFIPLKSITGKDTLSLYEMDTDKNIRIANLFNVVFPEPDMNQTNVIGDHYFVYSPVVGKIIADMLDGNIPASLYTTPYNDGTIITLLDQSPYKELLALDPIKMNMPDNLVEIHPHIGNTTVNLNLFQYRFITNVVRLITNNNPNKINLSGYLTITT